MILTVTLNLALDVTYHVDKVRPHGTNRVRSVAQRAGGKGVNVARVLHALGADVLVTGLCGGTTGGVVLAELDDAGLSELLYPIAGETRRTVTVVEAAGGATLFNEPGPEVSTVEWSGFLESYGELLESMDAVVLSGSLPCGAEDGYAELVQRAEDAGVPAVLDADGPALLSGVAAGPTLVKPNADELRTVTGEPDPVAAARELCAAGARSVVCSLGADGLIAVTGQEIWRARPPRPLSGNPVGAGDAAVAALTLGMVRVAPWPDRLRAAAALSAAAVLAPQAGDFDPVAYEELLSEVAVEAGA